MALPWNTPMFFAEGAPYFPLYFGALVLCVWSYLLVCLSCIVSPIGVFCWSRQMLLIGPLVVFWHRCWHFLRIAQPWLWLLCWISLLFSRIGCFSWGCAWSWLVFALIALPISCIWCALGRLVCSVHMLLGLLCFCICILWFRVSSFRAPCFDGVRDSF